MKKILSILIFAVIVVGGGYYIYKNNLPKNLGQNGAVAVGTVTIIPTQPLNTCCFAIYGVDNPGQDGVLKNDAQKWLDSQTNCVTKQLVFVNDFNEQQLKGKYMCSFVSVFHDAHGPICEKIAKLATVCVKSFTCNMQFTSDSCQSFADIPSAQKYISGLQSSLGSSQKIAVTGNQYYGWDVDQNLDVDKVTFEVTATQTTCKLESCIASGTQCGPAGSSAQCLNSQGVTVTQNCCQTNNSMSNSNIGQTTAPGQQCSYLQGACTGVENFPGSDFGTEECPNQWTNDMTSNVTATLVKTCGGLGSYCQFTCKKNYHYYYDSTFDPKNINLPYCVPNHNCLNQPDNSVNCNGAYDNLTQDKSANLFDQCPDPGLTTNRCAFICEQGYKRQGTKCVVDTTEPQSPSICTAPTYQNQAMTLLVHGCYGVLDTHYYKIPAGTYTSNISQADANKQGIDTGTQALAAIVHNECDKPGKVYTVPTPKVTLTSPVIHPINPPGAYN